MFHSRLSSVIVLLRGAVYRARSPRGTAISLLLSVTCFISSLVSFFSWHSVSNGEHGIRLCRKASRRVRKEQRAPHQEMYKARSERCASNGFISRSYVWLTLRLLTKWCRAEFAKILAQTALGFFVLGFVGFFVKLMFIVRLSSSETILRSFQPRNTRVKCWSCLQPINQIIIGA